jgi:hypothetical protein
MDKAVHIATEIHGLTFSIGEDGVWMNTSSAGKHTSINLANYAKEGLPLTQGLLDWCKELTNKYTTQDPKPGCINEAVMLAHDWVGDDKCAYCKIESLEIQISEAIESLKYVEESSCSEEVFEHVLDAIHDLKHKPTTS